MTRTEQERLGIESFDIILLSGDAYVDHPSFATALLGRFLWEAGYTVGVIAQPDWRDPADFTRLGEPNLFFSVSAGNLDSMVSHYTAAKKRRSRDLYSPGGRPGLRPDRATLVYTDILHRLFPETPVVIGGVEASLRRFAHYDYWSDQVRGSILSDAPADILVFGMGEQQLTGIADNLAREIPAGSLHTLAGTVIKRSIREYRDDPFSDSVILPSFFEVKTDKRAFATAYLAILQEQDPIRGKKLIQPHPKTVIIQNPPAPPMNQRELDATYELPYARQEHPSYQEKIPALEPVRFSVTSHRGCFGSCSFCSLTHHQGRIIQSRSEESILREVRRIASKPGFTGTISDIGGPTATMFASTCPAWETKGTCVDRSCISCASLNAGINTYLSLLEEASKIPGVKHVFIGSGIRYDLIPDEPEIVRKICRYVSGHLKIAPEHTSPHVLSLMNKIGERPLEVFLKNFEEVQKNRSSRQYVLPYFMSGHPGCTLSDMLELALCIRKQGLFSEQVQDFTPTPMTGSTCMYYTGLNPFTGQVVHVPMGREKVLQRALLLYRDPKNTDLVREALHSLNRNDLIGEEWQCLVPKSRSSYQYQEGRQKRKKKKR